MLRVKRRFPARWFPNRPVRSPQGGAQPGNPHSEIRSLRPGSPWPNRWLNVAALLAVAVSIAVVFGKNVGAQDVGGAFLNVSYDPTRELYRDLNERFALASDTARARWSRFDSPTGARRVKHARSPTVLLRTS